VQRVVRSHSVSGLRFTLVILQKGMRLAENGERPTRPVWRTLRGTLAHEIQKELNPPPR